MHTAPCINRTRQRASAFNIIHGEAPKTLPREISATTCVPDSRVISMQIRDGHARKEEERMARAFIIRADDFPRVSFQG